MRSQLGETCQILGFVGQVACRTETSAFVEFGGIGFLSVLSDCEGRHDCIITLSVPTSMSASISSHTAVAEIKRQVCLFFDLTPRRIVVKLCTPHEVRSEAEPFIAEVVTAELAESTAQSYPDWPSVYAAPPMPNASAAGRSPYLLVPAATPSEPEELYSVPRRYDLSSMFAISVAYGLLFSIMQALNALPSAIFLTGIFFAVVGAAQAIMFEGKKPREASMIAGGVAGFLCVVAFGIIEEAMSPGETASAALCSVVCCPIAGYLAGTTIGGIWLVADYLRHWSEARQAQTDKACAATSIATSVADKSITNDHDDQRNKETDEKKKAPHPLD